VNVVTVGKKKYFKNFSRCRKLKFIANLPYTVNP
jgi:hypothetical protein